jgi:S1-C subfamily serine protease
MGDSDDSADVYNDEALGERPSKKRAVGIGRGNAVGLVGSSTSSDRGVSTGTGSVCKLFVKKVPANFADPWRKHSQTTSTGTGFLIRGKWIITNAHVVHRAVSVLLRATTGPPVKYSARVVAIGLPCDLAVLEVDGEFWEGKESLRLSADLPRLDDNVTCIGFPVGGENISVTRGVVSRIDVNADGLMRVQIDAAINPGNSGGPVLGAQGMVVGVATSHLKNASNIGYIIPTAVLEQFLLCMSTPGSAYTGVASLGIGKVQSLESPALRRQLGLPPAFTGGVRVPAVWPLGPAVGKLQVDDVLVAVDGIEIGQDATVPLRGNERIHFSYLVTKRVAGREAVKLGVRRQGAEVQVEVKLEPERWLVPRLDGFDAAPEYAIFGGLVFVPLSQPWAELKGHDRFARVLVLQHWGVALPEEGHQIIVLSKVLAHQCNVGFHSLTCMVLHSFNGVVVGNLARLAEEVAACKQATYTFEFLRTGSDGKELVVLDRDECSAAEPEILKQHLIAESAMVRGPGGRLQPPAAWVKACSNGSPAIVRDHQPNGNL